MRPSNILVLLLVTVLVQKPAFGQHGITPPRKPICSYSEDCKCPLLYSPVCGSDGRTYENGCLLQCETWCNPELKIVSHGECLQMAAEVARVPSCNDAPDLVCTEVYEPVCGTNGITYVNDCELLRVQLCDSQLALASLGQCPQVTTEAAKLPSCNDAPDLVCTEVYEPVCGTNGITYVNSCELLRAQLCDSQLAQSSLGECRKRAARAAGVPSCDDAPDLACTEVYEPVCGTNGVTYVNSCELLRAQLCNSQLNMAHAGSCVSPA